MNYDTKVTTTTQKIIGSYSLSFMPGCSDLAISHDVWIYPEYRGKGSGQEQHTERLKKIAMLGHTGVICTVRADNTIEKHILKKFGWSQVWQFMNKDSEVIELWAREV